MRVVRCVCVCVCVCLCVCVCAFARARVCAGLWLITSNIVLLNMFIAILSEAYRKVGEEVQHVYMDVPTRARYAHKAHMQRSVRLSD